MMSGIRGKNTKPEILVRGIFARLRFKPELNCRELPGKPDIVLRRKKVAVFVHGCFWHGHDCHLFKWPSSRYDFWKKKITGNREQDQKVARQLGDQGWRVLVLWECSFKGKHRLPIDDVLAEIDRWLKSGLQCLEIWGIQKEVGNG